MADCGICLDVLHTPVSIPCGHIHCERCLRSHINSGADALKSTCPTCRNPFHIATPDFTFVPRKYHDFILPSVRKIYMDVPSVAALKKETGLLTQRLDASTKENEHLRRRCTGYTHALEDMELERQAAIEHEEETRQEVDALRRKYDSLKKKYQEALSRGDAYSTILSCRSVQNLEIHPKEEEYPVSLQDSNPPRPKRALPKSRLSNSMHHKDEQVSQLIKRQRTHRHSDIGPSSRLIKYEDE